VPGPNTETETGFLRSRNTTQTTSDTSLLLAVRKVDAKGTCEMLPNFHKIHNPHHYDVAVMGLGQTASRMLSFIQT